VSGPDVALAWMTGQASAQAMLLDGLDDPSWLVDAASLTVRYANPAADRWLGGVAGGLLGRAAETVLPTLEDAAFWAEVRDGARPTLASETELPLADGRLASVMRRIIPLPRDAAIAPQDYLVTLRDRSQERQAERERETLLAELRATLESTADGILVTDLAGHIQAFNRRFAALWSLPDTALSEGDDARVEEWMRLNVTQPAEFDRRLEEIHQHALLSADDTLTLIDGTLLERHTQPQWSRGRPIGRVYSFRELNRSRFGAASRDRCAMVDEWTNLPNRGAFLARLEGAVAEARHGGASLAVLCVEFDAEAVFGVQGGSSSHVRRVSELVDGVRACLRQPHVLARLGAARFGVLMERAGDAAAEALARRLLHQSLLLNPGVLATDGLAAVVGIASYPQGGHAADELLAHAEQTLVQARCAGDGYRVHRFAVVADTRRQERLDHALRQGLAAPQFRLQYQPRIDATSGEVNAVEAFVRWHDQDHGDLLPAQFLNLAERAGLAGTLDDWVMEQALHQAAAWRRDGMPLVMNLNVSGWQLSQPGFARRVEAALAHADWPASQLALDVTEAALQADPEAAGAALNALRRMGVRVILDDFGAGDASLSLLRRFPLSAVKLDRSLIRGLRRGAAAQPADAAMVGGLIGLAHALKLEILAEGVETEDQRRFIADQGCQGWQGFLCAPALDARQLALLVRGTEGHCRHAARH
jgi:diguanylate cyclase (GGDEF)-like protein